MLSDALETDLVRTFDREKQSNQFLRLASEGKLTGEQLATFLENSRFLISHTPSHFRSAANGIKDNKLNAVRDFFLAHAEEEVGHDKWAESDLASLSIATQPQLTPGVLKLIEHIKNVIKDEPAAYLGHVYFAECVAVVAGPSVVRWLTERCGFPISALSVLTRHVELDVDHIREDKRLIEAICKEDVRLQKSLESVFMGSARAYFRMCNDCAAN